MPGEPKDTRPKPPVPADLDLRHFPYMYFNVQRFLSSDLFHAATREGIGAALLLWCHAWLQVPAGSLPNNETILASMVGCKGEPEVWQRVREWALHGFVECSDGRLYHRVVVEFVLDAMRRQRAGRKGALSRWNPYQGELDLDKENAPIENVEENAIALRSQCEGNAKDKDKDKDKSIELGDRGRSEGETPNDNVTPLVVESRLKEAKSDVLLAHVAWNDLAERHPGKLTKVLRLSGSRRDKLAQRLKDVEGLNGWNAVLNKIDTTPVVLGDNERGWVISFDWLLSETNLIKLMEGRYDERYRKRGSFDPKTVDRVVAALKRG